ncbi:MAG: peptidoglycan-binding domain-containing protein [Planctomycetota bacterium]
MHPQPPPRSRASRVAALLVLALAVLASTTLGEEVLAWRELRSRVVHEGAPASVIVDRDARAARLVFDDPARPPATLPLSPELAYRLETEVSKATPARAWVPLGAGAEPEEIAALHDALARNGQRVNDTGFGLRTARAVRRFQSDHGLDPSGTVDEATRDALGLVPAGGLATLDGRPIEGRGLPGVLDVVAESVARQGEPERLELSGRLRDGGRTLETPEGEQLTLSGIHDGWEQALAMLPSAQVEVLRFPGSDEAVVVGITVQSTRKSLPLGVVQDRPVKVIGLVNVPERTVDELMGPHRIGGRVLLVEDYAGRRGPLHDPTRARAPRPDELAAEPLGPRRGMTDVIGGE